MKLWRTLGISLAVALALLSAGQGNAFALVEQLSLDELTAKADAILVGEVTDIASYQEGEGNIYTLVTLSVEQTIKGESGGKVVIKLPGGEVDGLGLWVSDTPSFQLGEKAVVFLEEVDNAFGVSGWYQGKFTVQDNRVVERDQSLTNFIADISQAMEAQGITPKLSVRLASMVLEKPLESKAVKPAKAEEFLTGWQNIMTDGFEGAFPGIWEVDGTPTWHKESFAHAGTYSVWCAGSTLNPPSDYPNNMSAWMVYGPFSLADATDAKVDFWLWLQSESGYDYVAVMASTNGTNFYGTDWSGDSGGWQSSSFDLTNVYILGNLTGQPQVWIAFIFTSDDTTTDKGAFIDDVVLQKYVAGGTTPQITSISPTSGPAGTGFEVTINGTNFGASQGSSTVTFWRGGGYTAPEAPIVSWSDTQIVCEVPSGASSGDTSQGVRITTADGISNDYPFTVTFSYGELKWVLANPMGEKFLINPNTADTTGEWRAVINAMQTWNDVANANFYFEYGGLTTATAGSWDTPNDVNEILWVNYYPPGFPSGWIAVNLGWSLAGEIVESDIVFNDLDFTWDTSSSPSGSQQDVQNVATHELGHSLLLDDLYGTADSEKTMYGFGGGGETKARTLEAEDIAGIRYIYPGTGTRGQYHISVTNNDDDDLTVYFKTDGDAGYEGYRQVSVPSGQTQTSFWEVVPAGSHVVSIKWTDPDKGTEDFLTSQWLNVPVEGDTGFAFTIPQYPAGATPSVTTNNASNITPTSATLNGNLSSLGTASTVFVSFEYGLTTAYGNETTPQAITTTGPFSSPLSSLSPNTTHHFRAKAVGNGTSYGSDKGFTTLPAVVPPATTATRDIAVQALAPGGSTNVTVIINNAQLQALGLDEGPPAGWPVAEVDNGGGTYNAALTDWFWMQAAAGPITVVYNLAVPLGTADGVYEIAGSLFSSEGTVEVGGDSTITVGFAILDYYRALTGDPLVADLADVVAAANDYLGGVIPPGFDNPITLTQLVQLANEWLTQ